MSASPRPVDLYPKYPVEPFPTFYLRTARAYRFLSTYLTAILGTDFMGQSQRLTEEGSRSESSLDRELSEVTELLYGLYALSSRSVGMKPEAGLLEEELLEYSLEGCSRRASDWLVQWTTDRDVLRDPRVIVPIARDGSGSLRAWATLGVKVFKVSSEFVKGHEPQVVDMDWCVLREFKSREYYLLSEQTVEVVLRSGVPPTRAELRQICDAQRTPEAIVRALEAR